MAEDTRMKKHRMMVNVDKDVYEWLRVYAHTVRVSMSFVLNEIVKTEISTPRLNREVAANGKRIE